MRTKVVTAVLSAAVAAGSACQAQAQKGWVTTYHNRSHFAASRLIQLAYDGNVRAQARLCLLYQAGLGVVQSFAVAATYCENTCPATTCGADSGAVARVKIAGCVAGRTSLTIRVDGSMW